MKKTVSSLFALALFLAAAPAQAYKYANAEAEYMVDLPDAPMGETIWAQEGRVPYIENPPKYGAVGEVATLKRMDFDTGDLFDVKITFVKADHDFLLELTPEKIEETLKKELSELSLKDAKFRISKGRDTLKWGTYSGYSVSENNDVLFNIVHYLVGEDSVMVVRSTYSVQNKLFNQYYKTLANSITYMGR